MTIKVIQKSNQTILRKHLVVLWKTQSYFRENLSFEGQIHSNKKNHVAVNFSQHEEKEAAPDREVICKKKARSFSTLSISGPKLPPPILFWTTLR